MADRFPAFIDRVLAHEGGYVNHPQDPGGETNHGITLRTARANGYSGAMRDMTRAQAVEIYRKAFWQCYRAAEMPSPSSFSTPASTTATATPPACCNAPQAWPTTA